MPKAMTVRLSEQLRREADRVREREGLTVNALIAVALREYLDRSQAASLAAPGVSTAAGGVSVPGEPFKSAAGAPVALAGAIAKAVQAGPRPGGQVKSKRRRGR